MKRILAFLLVGLMIFMMSACSYKLVEVEDLNKDQGEKVLDDWQGDYEEFVVDVQSDAEDAAKAEEEEKKEAEKKEKEEAAKKKEEAAKKKEEAAKKKEEQNKIQAPSVTETVVEEWVNPIIPETSTQTDPTPESVYQPEPEDSPYNNPPVRGSNKAGVYNNEYIGLNIRWPDGWVSYTTELGQSLESLLDEDDSTSSIHEMLAIGPDGAYIQIVYYNLRKSGDETIKPDDIFKDVGESIQGLDNYICNMADIHSTHLGGREWSVLPIIYKEGGQEGYMTYYATKIDCFMVMMILTSPNGNSLHLDFY